jgi:hypothetical protein
MKTLMTYMTLEILLPGGTLIALLLWVYRNRKSLFEAFQ